MSEITVRRMRFEYPSEIDPVFIAGEPEDSFANLALSLLLPYLEPYLIRTMKAAREHVQDPRLLEELKAFVLQEGQHFQQHKRFNELVHGLGFRDLAPLEEEMARDYERFTEEHDLAFNLAYAEGFEALTTAMATVFFSIDRSRWHPEVHALYEWHLVEELEHRCVAFDVYQAVVGDYFTRVRVGLFAQRHLLSFMLRATDRMMKASPEIIERLGGAPAQRARMGRLSKRLFLEILPRMLRTHLPGYSPHHLAMPEELATLRARYTAQAEHVVGSAE